MCPRPWGYGYSYPYTGAYGYGVRVFLVKLLHQAVPGQESLHRSLTILSEVAHLESEVLRNDLTRRISVGPCDPASGILLQGSSTKDVQSRRLIGCQGVEVLQLLLISPQECLFEDS
jgi:hypothetical protein